METIITPTELAEKAPVRITTGAKEILEACDKAAREVVSPMKFSRNGFKRGMAGRVISVLLVEHGPDILKRINSGDVDFLLTV